MNKKTGITIILLVALMVPAMMFFVACSKQTGTKTTSSKNSSSGYKMPGLMGEVTDIAGNDVTLKLIQIPKIPTGSRSSRSGSGSFSRPSGSGSYSFSRPSGSGSGSNNTSGTQRQRTVQYTGETKEIIIPVGTKIVTTEISQSSSSSQQATSGRFGRSGQSFVEVAITVDKIQIGDTLSFYYAADGTTITQVTDASASSGTAGYGAFFGGGGFGGRTGGNTNGSGN